MTHEIQKTIAIECPFEGGTMREEGNVEYAKRCMVDALNRYEAPFLSHLLFPHHLDDTDPEQRELGLQAGHAIAARLEAWAVYLDRGVTAGMLRGIDAALAAGFRPVHVGFPDLGHYVPVDRCIVFRTFIEGDHTSAEIRLNQCGAWPRLVEHFEKLARQSWDLPRAGDWER